MVRRTKSEAAVTRQKLLDAAADVFREHGVAHSSLAEVAAAAGLTVESFSEFPGDDAKRGLTVCLWRLSDNRTD